MANQTIRGFIEMVLENYFMEDDYADATGKATPVAKGMGFGASTGPATPRAKNLPNTSPSGQEKFNLAALKELKSLPEVQAYTSRTLPFIGEGTSRRVYSLGNGTVIKVAKNDGGLGQNQAEATVCTGSDPGLFPVVMEAGPAHMWIITEQAAEMTEEAFEQLTHLSWQTFKTALGGAFLDKLDKTKVNRLGIQQRQQAFQQVYANPFFRKMVNTIKACQYEPGDIAKLDSWGVVKGKPVIIDSGFTEAVNQTYYKNKVG